MCEQCGATEAGGDPVVHDHAVVEMAVELSDYGKNPLPKAG